MEATTEIPELNGFVVIKPAVGVELAMHTPEGETFERGQPGKPVGRISHEGQDPLGGRNDDGRPVRSNLDQREDVGAGLRRLRSRGGGRSGEAKSSLCGLGSRSRGGSRNGNSSLWRAWSA